MHIQITTSERNRSTGQWVLFGRLSGAALSYRACPSFQNCPPDSFENSPYAERTAYRDFAICGWRPRAHGSQREPYSLQANCARTVFQRKTVWFACEPWTPRFVEKNRVKLSCHYRPHIVRNPTPPLCASVKPPGSVCAQAVGLHNCASNFTFCPGKTLHCEAT